MKADGPVGALSQYSASWTRCSYQGRSAGGVSEPGGVSQRRSPAYRSVCVCVRVCNVSSSPQQHPGYNCVSRSKSREREQDKKENDATPRGKDKKEEKERKERKRVRVRSLGVRGWSEML